MALGSLKISTLIGLAVGIITLTSPMSVLADSTVSTNSTDNTTATSPGTSAVSPDEPGPISPDAASYGKVDTIYRTCADPNSISGTGYQFAPSGTGFVYGFQNDGGSTPYFSDTFNLQELDFDFESPDVQNSTTGAYYNLPDSSFNIKYQVTYGSGEVGSGVLSMNSLSCTDLQTLAGAASPSGNDGKGYWLATTTGKVYNEGDAVFYGSPANSGVTLAKPIVGITATPDGKGYWLFDEDGKVYPYGDAALHTSLKLPTGTNTVIGLTSTLDGKGYWLYSSKGYVWNEGDAVNYGQAVGYPLIGVAITPDGKGYWLATSTGSIYIRGDAVSYGSPADSKVKLGSPVVSFLTSSTRKGYWVVTSQGWVYSYGNADSSLGDLRPQVGIDHVLKSPVTGIVSTYDNKGYWLVTKDGSVFIFGDAAYYRSVPAS